MTCTVLIVDDSITVRMDLHDAFTGEGFRTLLCATAAQARAAIAEESFEVAVLDVLLPDGDGVQLLGELRSRPQHTATAVVLLSTEAEVADRIRGLHKGADEYVGKPYHAAHLVARVRQLLGERGPRSDGRVRVLVVDDSVTFREWLRSALEANGYAVLTAPTGEDGLRIAADRRPDALIVDGMLPGIDGAGVIRRIRLDAALRDIPCLLLTAAEDDATELQALEAGADAFVRKHQDLPVVLAKLAAVLRRRADALPIETGGSVHGPRRVLVIEADAERRTMLHEALRGDGYEVVGAATADEALAMLAAQAVDCLVLGLAGREEAGLRACSRLKAAPGSGEIPLVVNGWRDDPDALLDCLGSGADDYVGAADGPDTLRAHVRAQIRRKQAQDESRRIREELLRRELAAAEERAARELAETRAALVEELEWRNRELEAFSGSVSHDLRGPLQVVSAYAEDLLGDDRLDGQARHQVERIRAAADRMADLVDSLLVLARASRGDLRRHPFDLSATAWQVVKEVQARDPARDVSWQVHESMVADGDEGMIRIALENLVNNAWKFTGRTPQPSIEIGWTGPGAEPGYFIRDNGAGFPAGKAGELFRPFARLHSAKQFPGTGIGLTTVHRIVDRHGGRLWAEGEDGRGATFWFTLPPPRAD